MEGNSRLRKAPSCPLLGAFVRRNGFIRVAEFPDRDPIALYGIVEVERENLVSVWCLLRESTRENIENQKD